MSIESKHKLRTYALHSIVFECRGPFQSTAVDSAPKHSIRDPMHFPKHSIRGRPKHSIRGRPKHSIRPDQLLGSGGCQNHSIRGKACALDSCALEVTVGNHSGLQMQFTDDLHGEQRKDQKHLLTQGTTMASWLEKDTSTCSASPLQQCNASATAILQPSQAHQMLVVCRLLRIVLDR